MYRHRHAPEEERNVMIDIIRGEPGKIKELIGRIKQSVNFAEVSARQIVYDLSIIGVSHIFFAFFVFISLFPKNPITWNIFIPGHKVYQFFVVSITIKFILKMFYQLIY